ncbi:MAG: type VII toxin-antitoxin system MntA family adenylyltransferase antitoxin [Caldimicrobium sp.]
MLNMRALEEVIEKIKQYPQTLAIILFGSFARGEAKEMSDADIAVVIEKPDKHIEAEIGSMNSPFLDVVLFHRLPLHIQFEVLKYGKEVFCRDEKAFLEIKFKVLRDYLEMSPMYERFKKRILL